MRFVNMANSKMNDSTQRKRVAEKSENYVYTCIFVLYFCLVKRSRNILAIAALPTEKHFLPRLTLLDFGMQRHVADGKNISFRDLLCTITGCNVTLPTENLYFEIFYIFDGASMPNNLNPSSSTTCTALTSIALAFFAPSSALAILCAR